MRTTVTLDADTEFLLREEAARSGRSLEQVLHAAVRRVLAGVPGPVDVPPLFAAPFPADLSGFNRIGEAWDDEATQYEPQS